MYLPRPKCHNAHIHTNQNKPHMISNWKWFCFFGFLKYSSKQCKRNSPFNEYQKNLGIEMDRRYLERIWGTDFAAIHIWRNWSDCNLISFEHKLRIKKEILKTSYIIFFLFHLIQSMINLISLSWNVGRWMMVDQ